jgi:inosine/xanthosine triphosphate pyrophosphatase family protein
MDDINAIGEKSIDKQSGIAVLDESGLSRDKLKGLPSPVEKKFNTNTKLTSTKEAATAPLALAIEYRRL